MDNREVVSWLLEGDVALQYQVYRDLLGTDRSDLQDRIALEGWGKEFLSKRKPSGHWGDRFYQPKWISTHYTLLDLCHLGLSPENSIAKESIDLVLDEGKAEDGGIPLGPSTMKYSDVCVNGMFLQYASYFKTSGYKLESVVDSILNEIMPDGGFNCQTSRSGATHSSLHTTLSVLEGFEGFQQAGYGYRSADIAKAQKCAEEFILIHRLFLSDRTGKIIQKEFLKLYYPGRWKYNVLRALDYFRWANRPWDDRMNEGIQVVTKKSNKDGTWNMPALHPGQVHFMMETPGKPSRWNTLRAMRVLQYFGKDNLSQCKYSAVSILA